MAQSILLAVETSCDETAIAIMRGMNGLLASEIASQIPLHQPFGGVVPELASRNHLPVLQSLTKRALSSAGVELAEVDAFAATIGPGLASSLLIGASFAKSLAWANGKPYIGVNHLEGHLLSPFLEEPGGIAPSIALIVSGGHTLLVNIEGFQNYHVLGRTRDDAAGEAFDKVAKLIGLPYPGGPEIDRHATSGDPKRYDLPRSMMDSGDLEFSFSGLKTAVRYLLPSLKGNFMADLCASFQEAVVDVLVEKTRAACTATGRRHISLSGGVSCNSRLRQKMLTMSQREGFDFLVAKPRFCTDNAAMIAHAAAYHYRCESFSALELDIDPNLALC